MSLPEPESDRRAFLQGESLRRSLQHAADRLPSLGSEADPSVNTDELRRQDWIAASADTLRLSQVSMACDFEIALNRDGSAHLGAISDALELIARIEDQITLYRSSSELIELNRHAADWPIEVEPRLFELLLTAQRLAHETDGAFNPAAGPLVQLWRECRMAERIPAPQEIADRLNRTGLEQIELDETARTVRFRQSGVECNLNAIGKGWALDRAGELLRERGATDWLMHAGQSSLLSCGSHAGLPGWPVRLRNPLMAHHGLGTLRLIDRALSTSGNGVQFYRYQGQRYGHLIDPRTGWPVEKVLAVSVVAPTATEAEALSTAFFVLGVEKAQIYCHNHEEVGAIIVPPPQGGRLLEPVVIGLSRDLLFFEPSECATVHWLDTKS